MGCRTEPAGNGTPIGIHLRLSVEVLATGMHGGCERSADKRSTEHRFTGTFSQRAGAVGVLNATFCTKRGDFIQQAGIRRAVNNVAESAVQLWCENSTCPDFNAARAMKTSA